MTCAGSGVSASGAEAIKICKKLNLNYRGIAHLTMPQDYLMFFRIYSSSCLKDLCSFQEGKVYLS